MKKPYLKRIKFKSFEDLEKAIISGNTVLFSCYIYYLEAVYRKSANCICLKNINIGSVHDIWQIGKRTKDNEKHYPLENFIMFQNI